MVYERTLHVDPSRRSIFLFGPRQTGKTSLLRHRFPDEQWYNLLETDTFFRLSAKPRIMRDEVRARSSGSPPIIIIDEIQKLPVLLDEVQLLIDEADARFILTGSSARKLSQAGVNMLGGRARVRRLFPLTLHELHNAQQTIDLERVLRHGLLPSVYLSDDPEADLDAYCGTYLQQEVQQEGFVRKVDAFARFLQTAARMNAELINYEAIASDAAVPARTVREYFSILSDTLIADVLMPWRRGGRRKPVATGKLYFFDTGVVATLSRSGLFGPGTTAWGSAFEHLVYMELRAWLGYTSDRRELQFWRTRQGVEVDFVVGDDIAIEVKAGRGIGSRDLRGLRAIADEASFRHRVLVTGRDEPPRETEDGIRILSLGDFVSALWSSEFS